MATTTLGTFLQHLRGSALLDETAGLADGQLVERFVRRRDAAALEALLRRHGPMVWGVCRRVLRHEADAEDAFQATFLVLVRKAADVRPRGLVGNWLYGVARNTALKAKLMNDRRRAKERQATRPDPPAEDRDRLQALLDEELQALPDKYRAPIVLCELEGKSIQEAARHLGCPLGTVGTRLARGRRLLANRLTGRGVTLSAGGIAAVLAAGAVPAPLMAATVKATTFAAAGQMAGAVAPQILALTEGVLKAMLLTKCKAVAGLLLAVGVLSCLGMAVRDRVGFSATARGDTPAAVGAKPAVQPAQPPGRAAQLKELQDEYRKDHDALLKAIRAGKVRQEKDGGYPALSELRERYAVRARRLIDADPTDEVALDTVLFSMRDLVADAADRKLYDVLADHHLGSAKLVPIVGRPSTNERFLRAVLAKTPHAEVRGRATLALADHLTRMGRPAESERLLETLRQDKDLAKVGHHHGSLGKAAEDLLFEIRHLSVGKTAPNLVGQDLDKKPLKLSEYHGKVVLLVFWATWCGPCMAMVPHERELAKGYAGRPFAVVGVNGDVDIVYGPKGEEIDEMARVKATVKKEGMTWPSFRNECQIPETKKWVQISRRWNVDSWPTVYLLDHEGVIRQKFIGSPMRAELDREIKRLVAAAEAGRKKLVR